MFELLIALFGGLYVCGRCMVEKYDNNKIDNNIQRSYEERKIDYINWEKKVVDEKLEYELNNVNPGMFEIMYNKIKELGITDISREMVIMGMMAEHGKIPKEIARSGIQSRGVWDYEEKLKWVQQRTFLIWYDKMLQSHGIDEPLMFVKGHEYIYPNINGVPISEDREVTGGRYYWHSMRKYMF